LVIVYDESDLLTHEFITQHKFGSNFKIVNLNTETKLTLGEKRNISVKEADGDFVCIWDDDDWYDPNRLTEQMNHLLFHGKSGSILSRWIAFDSCSQKAYLSHKYPLEGSILCKRDVMLQTPYPSLPKNEDTRVIFLLYKQGKLSIINDMAHLYVYIFHGNNTWDLEHFNNNIFSRSNEMSSSFSREVMNEVSGFF